MEKKYFLKKDTDFTKVYRKKKTFGNRNLVLYMKKNPKKINRIGFSISKKVGKAVERNLIKRRLKVLYATYYPEMKKGYDLVIVVKPNVADLSFEKLDSAYRHLLRISSLRSGNQDGRKK